ncbi:stage II sporulation protein M [Virgibacillus kekensis]|uniref:Stage II sporulation protein M n=1 Tax=Virgibacillus kekensis TaxID=202261 RepID=A0ABV9DKX2_9BACI
MYTKRALIVNHLKEHATIYIFMIILFLTGVIFGAIIVNSMNWAQKEDLFFYLERFFGQIADEDQIAGDEILKSSFSYHAKYLLLLFILGLSVVGLPLVWVLLFLKGLVVGFSVGFIVNQLGMKGFLLASLSIAPQNLLIIPIYITAGSLSMIFSLTLLGKLFTRRIAQPVLQPLGKYVTVFSLLLVVSIVAAAIEAFIANEAMGMIIRSFYK